MLQSKFKIEQRKASFFAERSGITTMNVFTRPNFLIFFFRIYVQIGIYMRHIVPLSHFLSTLILISFCSFALVLFSPHPVFPASGIQNEKFETKAKEMTQLFTEELPSLFFWIFNNFPSSWTIKFDKAKKVVSC